MAERKRPPRREKNGSHAWFWWLLVLALIAGGLYWAYPRYKSYLRPAHVAGGDDSLGPVRNLRRICSANVSYQYSHPKQGYARQLVDLGPREGNYIDQTLASGDVQGYRYAYVAKPGRNGVIDQYVINVQSTTGKRNFYMDDACEIHATPENRAATASDPIVR